MIPMVTNREIGLKITGDSSDAEKAITNLKNGVSDLKDKSINIGIDGDGESKIKEIKGDAEKLGSETQTIKIDADTSGADAQIGNVKEELLDLQDMAAGIIIGGAVAGAADYAVSQDEALAKIRGTIGATVPDAERLATSIHNATSADWGTIAEGLTQVRTQTGLTGDELEKVTQQTVKFAKLWDEDVREVIRANNELARTFGISNEEAFNIMQRGFEETGDPADDLLDTFNEYDENFKQMGYSAKEFANILTSGLKHGVMNADQMADAIREAMIRLTTSPDERQKVYDLIGATADQQARWNSMIAEGGPAAKQAFDEIVDSIDSIGDPLKRKEAAVALFGSKFEDQGENIIGALQDETDYIGQTESAFNKSAEAGESWSSRIIKAIRSIPVVGPWLEGLLSGLGQFFTDILAAGVGLGLVDWVKKLWGGETTLKQSFEHGTQMGENLIKGIGDGLKKIETRGRSLVDDIFKFLGRGRGGKTKIPIPETDLTSGLDDAFSKMGTVADDAGEGVMKSWAKGLGRGALRALGTVTEVVGIVWYGLEGMYNAAEMYEAGAGTNIIKLYGLDMLKGVPFLGDIVKNIEGIINMLFGAIGIESGKSFLTKLIGPEDAQKVSDFWKTIHNQMDIEWANIMKGDLGLFTQPFTDAYAYLVAMNWGGLFEYLGGISNQLWGIGGNLVKSLSDGFNAALGILGQATDNLRKGIMDGLNWLSSLPQQAFTWGLNIINSWKDGISQGILNAKDWLIAKLREFGAPIEGHSPAKEGPLSNVGVWGQSIGYSFGTSVGTGIGNTTPSISQSASGVGNSATNSLSGSLNEGIGTVQEAGNNLVNSSLSPLVETAREWGRQTGVAYVDGFKNALGDTSVTDTAKDIVGEGIGRFTKGHSPPREGPLSKIDIWGFNVGKSYIEGIGKGMANISNIGIGLNRLSGNLANPSTTTNNNGAVIHVSLAGAQINSNLDAQKVGDTIGSSLANKLSWQANSAGISSVNNRR